MITITVQGDTMTSHLKAFSEFGAKKKKVMNAMGLAVVSVAQRSFNQDQLRQSKWKEKSDGTPSNLKRKGRLRTSLRITKVTETTVSVGSDAKYARIHQLGGVIRPKGGKALRFAIGGKTFFRKKVTIPARPYWPITRSNELTPYARLAVDSAVEATVRDLLGGPTNA